MNWNWPGRQAGSSSVLTDTACSAETRLKAIKRGLKSFRKSVEDSLRTTSSKNKNEELELRKKRSAEYMLGENVAQAVHMLNEERVLLQVNSSPLNTIMERYANFEKTLGHMLADNERDIANFLSGDTPLSRLLDKDLPAVQQAKKDLEQSTRRYQNLHSNLDKEIKKLEKMQCKDSVDETSGNENKAEAEYEAIKAQEEKRDKLQYEVDNLAKDVSLEQDKLTATLLTLVSRENRYASSILELMRIRKDFYEKAFNTISAELPNMERILNETYCRPVFGERLEDHLQATNRCIAYPISVAVTFLRQAGLNDEGLFRISPKQIKLDKFKAFIDANMPFPELLLEGDVHLHSALLKSYLRELPEPLLGRPDPAIYYMWLDAALLRSTERKILEIRRILQEDLPSRVVENIQFLVKFLYELSQKCNENKMTPHNVAIVLGPTLLWSRHDGSLSEHSNLDRVISIVTTLIENYPSVFPHDFSWDKYDDEEIRMALDPPETPCRATLPECQSPKRSNIFKSKFLAKINNNPLTPRSQIEPGTQDPNLYTVNL